MCLAIMGSVHSKGVSLDFCLGGWPELVVDWLSDAGATVHAGYLFGVFQGISQYLSGYLQRG